MLKIFISYRRADSRKDAGRIYDRMAEAFGKEHIFKDVDSIPMGKDFRGVLREAVAACDVQLVIIGRSWLTITDDAGRQRLTDADDFVHIEVESALQRDSCLVIPVLVDNAQMPRADDLPPDLRELAFKNAAVVRDDPDFHADVSRIIASLSGHAPPRAASAAFDVHDAIGLFYQAYAAKDWDAARMRLAEIRVSDAAPRVFDVNAHEAQVWAAIGAEEREKDYQILRLMARRGDSGGVWTALQAFWQTYPGYDPDRLARFAPAGMPAGQSASPAVPMVDSAAPAALPSQISTPPLAAAGDKAARRRAWSWRFAWAFAGALAAFELAALAYLVESGRDSYMTYYEDPLANITLAMIFALGVVFSDQPWQDRRGQWPPRRRAWMAGLVGFGAGLAFWVVVTAFQFPPFFSDYLLHTSYGANAVMACLLGGVGFGLSFGLMNQFRLPGWLAVVVVLALMMLAPAILTVVLFDGDPAVVPVAGPSVARQNQALILLAFFIMALGVNAGAVWQDVQGLWRKTARQSGSPADQA